MGPQEAENEAENGTIIWTKRQLAEWENFYQLHIQLSILSRIYKELKTWTSSKQLNFKNEVQN